MGILLVTIPKMAKVICSECQMTKNFDPVSGFSLIKSNNVCDLCNEALICKECGFNHSSNLCSGVQNSHKYTLTLQRNKTPDSSQLMMDRATSRKIRVLHFESKFVIEESDSE